MLQHETSNSAVSKWYGSQARVPSKVNGRIWPSRVTLWVFQRALLQGHRR
jgi:hypothetical protein